MANTSILKDTPTYAQGIVSTLLRCQCVGLDDVARANKGAPQTHHAAESSFAKWLGVLFNDSSENEALVAQCLSQAWQIQRVQDDEWRAYEAMLSQESVKPLPKALREASQGVVSLGTLGVGLPKLGVLDASDAQVLQGLAFIFHEPFEWRLLSLSEYLRLQSMRRR